jgi:molecular chaperone HscC
MCRRPPRSTSRPPSRGARRSRRADPRDALPNRTALARAEAIYPELRGDVRQRLGRLISAFQLALEEQDPTNIDPLREALNQTIEAFRRG